MPMYAAIVGPLTTTACDSAKPRVPKNRLASSRSVTTMVRWSNPADTGPLPPTAGPGRRSVQLDLAKPTGLDLVDEAADGLVRDERARLDTGGRLLDVVLGFRERLQGEARSHA